MFFGGVSLLAAFTFAASAWVGCEAQQATVDPTKSPIILRPNGAEVWTVRQVETIRWSNKGLGITNERGRVLLGYIDPNNGGTQAFIQQPLADGFALADEVLNVVVPPGLPTGDFYYITLLGNAANQSPLFTIVNPAAPTQGTPGNITFPGRISVSNAPSATVSHLSTSSTTSSDSEPTPPTTSTTPTPSGTGTSGACRRVAGSGAGAGWLLMPLLSIAAVLAA